MLPLLVLLALNVVAVVLIVRTSRQPAPRKRLRQLALGLFGAFVLSAGLGVVLGLLAAFGAVGGESVDPSQKARILAEGISEAMNCTAFGIATFTLPALVALALFLRAPKA